ncbi:MAG: restriction endonuclease subunit S [Desulfobacterales bacterium]|nr:restriction endonuclease subunit S [Desulfobacterales bacterium]
MNHIYQEMQNSDAVWLGEVPSRWKTYRIKDITRLSPNFSNGTPNKKELCSVIPMDKVSEKGEIFSDNVEEYSLITSGLTNFEAGDVIFAKITPCMENGKGAYVGKLPVRYAFGSTEFHVLRPRYTVDGKFLYYYTYNSLYRHYAEVNMTGAAGQKRVSSRFINYTRIFLPDTQVQQRIAAYLDKTCAVIDKAIEAKQKQLEILDALRKSIIHKAVTRGLDDSVELKDSGVEWLGKIPKHWEFRQIKRDFQITLGKMLQSHQKDNKETEEFYLRSANIKWDNADLSDVQKMWFSPDEKKRLKLEYDDLLVSEGGDVGRTSIWKNELSACFIQNAINRVRARKKDRTTFLYYWLFFMKHVGYIDAIVSRITIAHLTAEKLEKIYYVRPPVAEQSNIVTFLDKKTDEISKIEGIITSQISTLQQYRKSLIHECVTGKRRITEDDMQDKL